VVLPHDVIVTGSKWEQTALASLGGGFPFVAWHGLNAGGNGRVYKTRQRAGEEI
jgi:hypothetical protein